MNEKPHENIQNKTNKKNKWILILLLISLSVNLLIIGAFIGSAYHFTKPFWGISEKRYEHIEDLARPHFKWFKTQRKSFKKDILEIAAILRKENYNRNEMHEKLEQLKQKVEQTTGRMAMLSIDIIDNLTPKERRQLATLIEKNIKGKKYSRGKRF